MSVAKHALGATATPPFSKVDVQDTLNFVAGQIHAAVEERQRAREDLLDVAGGLGLLVESEDDAQSIQRIARFLAVHSYERGAAIWDRREATLLRAFDALCEVDEDAVRAGKVALRGIPHEHTGRIISGSYCRRCGLHAAEHYVVPLPAAFARRAS